MKLILAKHAGYCFGVKKAMDLVNNEAMLRKLYTYGPLIHNKEALKALEIKGVNVIEHIDEAPGEAIVIRTHGVAPDIYQQLLAHEKSGGVWLDATCPSVKKIHKLAQGYANQGYYVIIIGDPSHPEVKGIYGWAGKNACIIKDCAQAELLTITQQHIVCVVQTTFDLATFNAITAVLKKKYTHIEIQNTICNATALRQAEASALAAKCDVLLVVGDKNSANTRKLYEICKKICRKTYFIETIYDLELNNLSTNDKIGITAGASTSPTTLKEVVTVMSDLENNMNEAEGESNQTFEEMLEDSFVSLHTGDIVKGNVIAVSNGEISVNLGYKSDGIIPREETSHQTDEELSQIYSPGNEIDVYVVRVNDGDGNVLLSRRRVEAQKGMVEVEAAFENNELLTGKVIEIVKGGLIVSYKSVRVFIPSSQVSNRYVEDLAVYKGQELNFKIIELDRSKRRIVGGRKEIALKEENERKEAVYSTIKAGDKINGKVSRIVDFGAFVDIGGVDGLIHISEMSWGTVKSPRDVLSEGEEVEVFVLDINPEKGKISLTLKDPSKDPWNLVAERYVVGENVNGTVVRMVPFGAFVELEPGVDGLVHISQIANRHVVKPEDELSVGEEITVRVTDVNLEQRKISLSKKEADSVDWKDEQEPTTQEDNAQEITENLEDTLEQ